MDKGWLDCDFDDDDDIEFICAKPERKRKLLSVLPPQQLHHKLDASSQLWLDKHKPTSLKQVAGNKAKIQLLHTWLSSHTGSPTRYTREKILVISGPSGCGKTTALEAVAEDLSVDIHQWYSQHSEYHQDSAQLHIRDNFVEYQSQTSLFQNFLLRANKYNSLPLDGAVCHHSHIVLVEDIPNTYLRNPTEWHNILRMYNKSARCPLVVIYNTSGSVSDRTMFPENLQSELHITHIAFNPIPKTDMRRVLTTICDAELGYSASEAKTFVTSLSEQCEGDIRTAVNTLQFTYCKSSTNPTTDLPVTKARKKSKTSAATSGRRGSRSSKSEAGSEDSQSICHKDPTLVIFRALGKVLYCKRKESQDEAESVLPTHLIHHSRNEMQFEPEQVFEQSKVSSDYYRLCLHQNYPHFLTNIENARRAAEYLADSDCLSDRFESRNVTGRAPVGVSVAARGLMHSNTSMAKQKPGWLPLRKPAWFLANRQTMDSRNSIKYENESLHSTSSLTTDVIPALHRMGVVHSLSRLISPLDVTTTHRYNNNEKLDERYSSYDVKLDTSVLYSGDVTGKIFEKTTDCFDESLVETTPQIEDDPDEFFIEDVG